MSVPKLLQDGQPLTLAKRIGKGGEGEVYALADRPDEALKYYTRTDGGETEAKVSAMIAAGLFGKTSLVAFPRFAVRLANGQFAGFIMKLVKGHKPLFDLYAPGARKANFPDVDYRFIVRAALNIARAVASVHASGCVIGDINHSSILVSEGAIAALIDADSFQFAAGGRQYLCRVGVPEYTPPELQGQRLDRVTRTTTHDCFGLAVVIFQLLFMGRHPFVGSYTRGEMPLEKAIAEHRFAYSRIRNVGMTPPPGAMRLEDLPSSLQGFFESAFSAQGAQGRPSAQQWINGLVELEASLGQCSANALHWHSKQARECPWCRMEKALGVLLFLPPIDKALQGRVEANLDLSSLRALWASVDGIILPDWETLRPLTPPIVKPSAPSQQLRRDQNRRSNYRVAGIVALLAVVPLLFVPSLGVLLSVASCIAGVVSLTRVAAPGETLTQRYIENARQIEDSIEDWRRRSGWRELAQSKADLIQSRRQVEALPLQYAQARDRLERERREAHLVQFLDKHRIAGTKIRGVGRAKLATLASYGIETAGDIKGRGVLHVPGFGPVNSQALLTWVAQLERRFVFDPRPTPSDLREASRLASEFDGRLADIKKIIANEAQRLVDSKRRFEGQLSIPDPRLLALLQVREQLLVDMREMGVPTPAVQPTSHAAPTITTPAATMGVARVQASSTSGQSGSIGRTGMTPPCPTCGSPMVQRIAGRGPNRGHAFWGCSRYPTCTGTRSYP